MSYFGLLTNEYRLTTYTSYVKRIFYDFFYVKTKRYL